MRRRLVPPAPTISRINLTPVIGLALVLVLILLITGPMFEVADVEVALPVASSRGPDDPLRITVTIGPDGELAIDEHRVERPAFAAAIGELLADGTRRNDLVVVRADETLPHREVREIVATVSRAGATRVAIATRQRPGAQS